MPHRRPRATKRSAPRLVTEAGYARAPTSLTSLTRVGPGRYIVRVTQTPAYPFAWEADVVLHDGTTTHLRPIRPDDAAALQRLQERQSERSSYFRFFAPVRSLSERELELFTHVDHVSRVALVAVRPDGASEGGED